MRAEIDWDGFAEDVEAALDGRSGRSICGGNGLNPALMSRARNGEVLSAATYLALCRALRLDPWARFGLRERPRLRSLKDVLNQRDTAPVSRGTERGAERQTEGS